MCIHLILSSGDTPTPQAALSPFVVVVVGCCLKNLGAKYVTESGSRHFAQCESGSRMLLNPDPDKRFWFDKENFFDQKPSTSHMSS